MRQCSVEISSMMQYYIPPSIRSHPSVQRLLQLQPRNSVPRSNVVRSTWARWTGEHFSSAACLISFKTEGAPSFTASLSTSQDLEISSCRLSFHNCSAVLLIERLAFELREPQKTCGKSRLKNFILKYQVMIIFFDWLNLFGRWCKAIYISENMFSLAYVRRGYRVWFETQYYTH